MIDRRSLIKKFNWQSRLRTSIIRASQSRKGKGGANATLLVVLLVADAVLWVLRCHGSDCHTSIEVKEKNMKRAKVALFRLVRKIGRKGEHFFHATYLGMVGIEAHGYYRFAAIALLITVIANAIAGLVGDE